VGLYSAFLLYLTQQGVKVWFTQFYLHITPYLPLPHKCSPDGTTTDLWWRPSNCRLLLIYRPQKDERPSWPSWLIYSEQFIYVSGYPPAVGWVQCKESLLVLPLCRATNSTLNFSLNGRNVQSKTGRCDS